jgi:hypothetical protein
MELDRGLKPDSVLIRLPQDGKMIREHDTIALTLDIEE